jgi:hypothetical protein
MSLVEIKLANNATVKGEMSVMDVKLSKTHVEWKYFVRGNSQVICIARTKFHGNGVEKQ